MQGMKLFVNYCPKYPTEIDDMTKVPYASVVGSLMYAMVCMILDIFQVVGVLSHFMANLGWVHWYAIKRVFRYLWVTFEYALCFLGYPTRPQHYVRDKLMFVVIVKV